MGSFLGLDEEGRRDEIEDASMGIRLIQMADTDVVVLIPLFFYIKMGSLLHLNVPSSLRILAFRTGVMLQQRLILCQVL